MTVEWVPRGRIILACAAATVRHVPDTPRDAPGGTIAVGRSNAGARPAAPLPTDVITDGDGNMLDQPARQATLTDEADLLVQRDGPVAYVILNRPRVHNAFSLRMWRSLASVMAGLGRDDTIRAIVIRGAGERAFASGADIAEFPTHRGTPEQGRAYHDIVEAALHAVTAAPQPVIAMIHGYCVGGGCELAVACDIRLCDDRAQFGIPAAKLGVVLGLQELRQLYELIGVAAAKELLLTGRLLDAGEALRIGLVHRVTSPAQLAAAVDELTARIAGNAPLAVAAVKRLLDGLAAGWPQPELEALQADFSRRSFASAEYQEAVRAFLGKGATGRETK